MLGTMAWSDDEAPQLRVNAPRGGQQVSQLRTLAPRDNLTLVLRRPRTKRFLLEVVGSVVRHCPGTPSLRN